MRGISAEVVVSTGVVSTSVEVAGVVTEIDDEGGNDAKQHRKKGKKRRGKNPVIRDGKRFDPSSRYHERRAEMIANSKAKRGE